MPRGLGTAGALCAAAGLAVLAGCQVTTRGSASDSTTVTIDPNAQPRGAEVRFQGPGSLPGGVYLLAGPDKYTSDLYRVGGRLDAARRLTFSTDGMGVSDFTGHRGRVVVSDARKAGIDHVETLAQLQRNGADGGARGSAPALASDGTLAYRINGPHGSELVVKRPGRRPRRIAGAPSGGPFFGPDDRIYYSGRKHHRSFIVAGFGARGARTIHTPIGRPRGVMDPSIAISSRGHIAYNERDGHLAVITSAGKLIARHRTRWFPLTWSPDGRSLLVTDARNLADGGTRIALLDPRSGHAQPLATTQGGTTREALWFAQR